MKSNLFDIKVDKNTGGVSSMMIASDRYNMDWCGRNRHWGELNAIHGEPKTFFNNFKLISCEETCSVFANDELRVTLERSFDDEGNYIEKYTFKNISGHEMFFNKGDVGIFTPLCDEYHAAEYSLTNKCNAHVWCGEEISWINALRQGNSDKNIGMVLLEGSLDAYSIDRENQKITHARRGNIIVHPELISLCSDEEYILKWKIFVHSGTEDFFKKLDRDNRNLDLNIDKYTIMGDEEFCFDFKGSNAEIKCGGKPVGFTSEAGRIFVKYKPEHLGEHIFKITVEGKRTHLALFAAPGLEELAEKRINYIVDRQQYSKEGSRLDGAYLVYDVKEERQFFGYRHADHNASRERVGMGLLIARYLQTHENKKAFDSLMKWVGFVKREFVDTETGQVFDNIGMDPTRKRLYNAPWVMMLMAELYKLTGKDEYLDILVKIVRRFYSDGGESFYPNAINPSLICEVMREAKREEADEIEALFVKHAENMVKTGLNYPPHEVIYEQTIVTPAVTFITGAGIIKNDKSYIGKVGQHMAPLRRFDGMQPDYRFNGIPIRYWDDYWFGKAALFADTLHYWSCLSAYSNYSYYVLSGDEEYRKYAENCIRNCMCLFFPDGSASCAYVQPFYVDGIRGNFYDEWANDQDFALYYAMLMLQVKG